MAEDEPPVEIRESIEPPAEHTASCCYCPDILFLVGWIGSVIAMVSVASVAGAHYDDDESGKSDIFIIFTLSTLFAISMTMLWVKVMIKFGGVLITCLFFVATGIAAFMCVVCLSYDLIALGCVFAVMGGCIALYYCCYRNHMLFASKTLAVASKIVQAYPATELVALIMVLVTAVWSITFAAAAYGLDDTCSDKGYSTFQRFMAWFAIVMMYYWGVQVFRGIVVCTTAGTAAEWWFSRKSPRHPTWSAFERAVTVNLGSICFAAFFVSLVQTTATMLAFIKKEVEKVGGTPGKVLGCMLCCCVACAGCLAALAEWMTSYAYIIIGVYGYGFAKSGGHVLTLFKSHGLLIAEQDLVVSIVLFLGQVVVALTTGAFGALLAKKGPDLWTDGVSNAVAVSGTVSAFIGYGVALVCLTVVEAADQAVLITFMEHPKVLENNHPAEHDSLAATWKLMGEKEEEAPTEGGAPTTEETV